MGYMFTYSKFNRDISKWDVSNVKNMEAMFAHCYYFNKDISKWNINKNCNVNNMFIECPIKDEYKPQI
jgi:surface protein